MNCLQFLSILTLERPTNLTIAIALKPPIEINSSVDEFKHFLESKERERRNEKLACKLKI